MSKPCGGPKSKRKAVPSWAEMVLGLDGSAMDALTVDATKAMMNLPRRDKMINKSPAPPTPAADAMDTAKPVSRATSMLFKAIERFEDAVFCHAMADDASLQACVDVKRKAYHELVDAITAAVADARDKARERALDEAAAELRARTVQWRGRALGDKHAHMFTMTAEDTIARIVLDLKTKKGGSNVNGS